MFLDFCGIIIDTVSVLFYDSVFVCEGDTSGCVQHLDFRTMMPTFSVRDPDIKVGCFCTGGNVCVAAHCSCCSSNLTEALKTH